MTRKLCTSFVVAPREWSSRDVDTRHLAANRDRPRLAAHAKLSASANLGSIAAFGALSCTPGWILGWIPGLISTHSMKQPHERLECLCESGFDCSLWRVAVHLPDETSILDVASEQETATWESRMFIT